MGSINDVIEVFRQSSTNSERRTLFEKLMVRYSKLPVLADRYDEVSLENQQIAVQRINMAASSQ